MPEVAERRKTGRGRGPNLGGPMPRGNISKTPQGVPKRGPGGMLPQRGGKMNPPGTGMMNPPGQGGPGTSPRPTGGGQGGGKAGIGGQALPGPGGRQLEARVKSGAITQEQAQRTMQQRQTLAKALGPNWRDKLQVGGKSFADVNKQLKANPGNAKLAAIRKKLIANRATVLAGARKGGAGKKKTPAEPAGAGAE